MIMIIDINIVTGIAGMDIHIVIGTTVTITIIVITSIVVATLLLLPSCSCRLQQMVVTNVTHTA